MTSFTGNRGLRPVAFLVQQIQSIWFPMITVQNCFGQVTRVLADSMFWLLVRSPSLPYCNICNYHVHHFIMGYKFGHKTFIPRIGIFFAVADVGDAKSDIMQ